MKTKEEYVEFVKEWKEKHAALTKLQRYIKRYLIKSEYPNEKYKLSQEEITEILKKHPVSYSYWGSIGPENLFNKNTGTEYYKQLLSKYLRWMYETRVSEKEKFKNSVTESVGI